MTKRPKSKRRDDVVDDEALRPAVRALLALAKEQLARRDAEYARLREFYRPSDIRVLFIGESPPEFDPYEEMRFFYSPNFTRHDNLYRGIAQAVYGSEPEIDLRDKPAVLKRLKRDGYWLIDAIEEPVNTLTPAERRQKLKEAVPDLVHRSRELKPWTGVVICHREVFRLASKSLAEAGVRVLHAKPLPFPVGNWRAAFVVGVRAALVAR